jgi:hypothetical protein
MERQRPIIPKPIERPMLPKQEMYLIKRQMFRPVRDGKRQQPRRGL